MRQKTRIINIIFFSFILSGCATAQGFKTDVQNTWTNISGFGNAVQRADDWIKTNLW